MSIQIFVPAYGESPYLRECLKSINELVPPAVKCTVIDDAWPGNEIFEITQEFSNRFQYIKNKTNLGVTKNFEKCFNLSRADFTLVIGSDDKLKPNYFENFIDSIARFPNATLVQPGVEVIDENGMTSRNLIDFIKGLIAPSFKSTNQISNSSFVFRLGLGDWLYFPSIAWRTSYVRQLIFPKELESAIDLHLLFQTCTADQQIIYNPIKSFEYRRHSKSVSSKMALNDKRVAEELSIHISFAKFLFAKKQWLHAAIVYLAPTSRLHGILSAFRSLPDLNAFLRGIQSSLKIR